MHSTIETDELVVELPQQHQYCIEIRRGPLADESNQRISLKDLGMQHLSDDEVLLAADSINTLPSFNALQILTPFPDDERIGFDKASHTYTFNGICARDSVTGLIEKYKNPFDKVMAVSLMRNGTAWEYKKHKYMCPDGTIMSDEAIWELWERNRVIASLRGTLTHWLVEALLNGACIESHVMKELEIFMEFYTITFRSWNLTPVRTELKVYSTMLNIAGQIDLLAKNPDTNLYVIIDWKRSKELKHGSLSSPMKYPLVDLPDCNYTTYKLQLQMYRHIVETEYFIPVAAMYIVMLHPEYEGNRVIHVDRMSDDLHPLLRWELQNGSCAR